MFKQISQQLFNFIEKCPTALHTVKTVEDELVEAGFERLYENEKWDIKEGGKYYVVRSMTSIIAFKYPKANFNAFSIIAPHGDSPCFRVKENPEIGVDKKYTKLNTEVYGGMQLNLWTDRTLSAAGRLLVKSENGVKAILVDLDRDLFVIPSLAIHMLRDANEGFKMNPQVDTLPLFGGEKADFLAITAEKANISKEDILSFDMFLYNRAKGKLFGADEEFIICPKLDDLQCAFSALTAFMNADNTENVTVCAIFDNEEIGSKTKQGADSSFLSDTLERISQKAGKTIEEHKMAISGGFMVSADNAHAVHPSYPEKTDPTNRTYLNGGVVIKNNTNYATDSVSSAIFKTICERADVPFQIYFNRSDVRGGSTLGNISNSHVSINTVDIGAPQLAMHSPYETSGAKDTKYMVDAMTAFYQSVIKYKTGGEFEILNGK